MLRLRMATGATNYISNLSVAKQIAKVGKLAPSTSNSFSLKSIRKNTLYDVKLFGVNFNSMPLRGNKMNSNINRMLNDAQSVKKAADDRGMSHETHYKTN